MRKILLFAAIALLGVATSNGINCLTMGDTIRIKPAKLDGYSQHQVTMYNDGFVDSWAMSVNYPAGLMVKLVAGVTPLDGMTIPYVDKNGNDQLLTCPLTVSAAYADIASEITTSGYWDYNMDGDFESYGTVKWSPGAHSMFEYNLYLDPSFRAGYITFDGTMSSGYDQRGPILQGVKFFSRTWVWVGYMKGDVTGNERITIDDVTDLIDYLLGGYELDEFQLAAADVNSNGSVTISDVTALIDLLLKN